MPPTQSSSSTNRRLIIFAIAASIAVLVATIALLLTSPRISPSQRAVLKVPDSVTPP